MDKEAIRAKACGMVNKAEEGELYVFDVEAALTAAYDAGWDEAIEAVEKALVSSLLPNKIVDVILPEIRRLRKGKA